MKFTSFTVKFGVKFTNFTIDLQEKDTTCKKQKKNCHNLEVHYNFFKNVVMKFKNLMAKIWIVMKITSLTAKYMNIWKIV